MAGVVFIVSVPTKRYNETLKKLENEREDTCDLKSKSSSDQIEEVSSTTRKPTNYQTFVDNKQSHKNFKNCKQFTTCLEDKNEDDVCMEKKMELILAKFRIENVTRQLTMGENFTQFMFSLEPKNISESERLLDALHDEGIGVNFKSEIKTITCCSHCKGTDDEKGNMTNEYISNSEFESVDGNSGWSKFITSVRAKITVSKVVEDIKHNAALTFDFVCLLVTATIICAIGLIENNNVYLISSMLVSPMMGPVMAGTFGTVIRDHALKKMGVQAELIGLGIATAVGFCCGAFVCLLTDKYGETDWPTIEMISRGGLRSLGMGCVVAFVSGAAVALGVLSHNVASLVGVAISTSLMPPAVNAGLLWSLAFVYYFKGDDTSRYSSLSYTNYYSDDRATELISLGAVSLCLTFANIVCIYISGILIFKIKEVTPIASRDERRRLFWNRDIKIVRNHNRNQHREGDQNKQSESGPNEEMLVNKFLKLNALHERLYHSTDMVCNDDCEKITRLQCTWSPCTEYFKPTIWELKKYYKKMSKSKMENGNAAVACEERGHSFTTGSGPTGMTSQDALVPIHEIIGESDEKEKCGMCPLPCVKVGKEKKRFVVTPFDFQTK